MLGSEVFGDVRLHGVHPLADGLLAKPALSSQVSPETFFLPESSPRINRIVQRRDVRGGELGPQGGE